MLRYARTLFTSALTTTTMQRQLDIGSNEVRTILQGDVSFLCEIFLKNGYEIRVVGGSVRDMLMKQKSKDIDLSTTATPDEMIKVFNKNNIRYIETGLQHGTLTVHFNEKDYEITTLRIDVETYGRAAKVEFTHDWMLDAERRDLTVNAMSMDVDGYLYDYFGGETDLKEGKVRFVGDPKKRIREDYLRILRYFRFYGRIAPNVNNHEHETLVTIKEQASGLQNIAVERIWVEVSKILVGNYAPELLRLMYELDVAKNIGLPACSKKHLDEFKNVWVRTRLTPILPVTLLTTLVDDEQAAEKLCLHWKLSNSDKILCGFIASHRYLPDQQPNPLKLYQDILVRKCNSKNTHIIREQVSQLLYYRGKVKECDVISAWTIPSFPLTGNDLIKANVKKGPDFGKVLNTLKDMWIDSDYTLSKEFLSDQIQSVYQRIKNNKPT